MKDSLKLFISYSHKNIKIKEKMITALKSMEYDYNIDSVWHDGKITAGENIDDAVLRELNTSDIILLLVSPDFLASFYCIEVELKKSIKRMNKGECIVVPIIICDCSIPDNLLFSKLKRLPDDGRPISNKKYFQNQQQGCTSVVNGLKILLDQKFDIKIQEKKRTIIKPKSETNFLFIKLYKDGMLKQIPITQEFISEIPNYNKYIHNFRTITEQSLSNARSEYLKVYKENKKSGINVSSKEQLKLFRMYLMDICAQVKIHITENIGIKAHFRITKGEYYLGLIAATSNDNESDLMCDWTTEMTPIPIYKGLIYYSSRFNAPLIKSLNSKLNHKGKNDKLWKDYVTFTFEKFRNGQTPIISFGISIQDDHYKKKPYMLMMLAYLDLGYVIQELINRYLSSCKSIDKSYNFDDIINEL